MLHGARSKLARPLVFLGQLVVALALIAALPVSQLRLVTVIIECCCPDPDHCQCPDHKSVDGSQPTLEPCHRTATTLESPSPPSVAPVIAAIDAMPARALTTAFHTHASPHDPPSLERPSAPS